MKQALITSCLIAFCLTSPAFAQQGTKLTFIFVPRDHSVFSLKNRDQLLLEWSNYDAQCRYDTTKEVLEQGLSREAGAGFYIFCMKAKGLDLVTNAEFQQIKSDGLAATPSVVVRGFEVDF